MRIKSWISKRFGIRPKIRKMIKCIFSREQLRVDELISSSESLATRDYSASGFSSRAGEMDAKVDNSNIEEAESSLRESGYLNYEEARALLGRLEFQKGSIEAALHVFEGIDVTAVTSRMKVSLSRRCDQNRRRSQSDAAPPMSMHAVSLLLEAIFLKTKSLQGLGRFEGELWTLAHQVEEVLPGVMGNKKRYCTLALCYLGEGEHMVALNLLRNLLDPGENSDCNLELLVASKICAENKVCIEEGITYACKALSMLQGKCRQMASIANCLLGVLLSSQSRSVVADSKRILKQSEALVALETAEKTMRERDPYIIYHLCLENAEQRKLDVALYYAKQLLNLEARSNVKGYLLLARVLSAQKQFADAESVINDSLDQTGKWDQGELLRTKAKLQIAQGRLKNAIETYVNLLAVLQFRKKSFSAGKNLVKNSQNHDRSLEMETWHDLANVYTSLSQWRDAEVCLSKSKAINPYSASGWHSTGLLYEAKGLQQEALVSFRKALDAEPNHVPSLVSIACVLRQIGGESMATIRCFLTDALRLDRTNTTAWYNLGLLYKTYAGASTLEAVECFEAAALLEESAPVEPFR